MKKGLAGRISKSESKSKSRAFKSKSKSLELKSKSKSKSSKNGLKSGLESKSGLKYYKSVCNFAYCKKRATKMIQGMGNFKYPERLRQLELPTLAYQRN